MHIFDDKPEIMLLVPNYNFVLMLIVLNNQNTYAFGEGVLINTLCLCFLLLSCVQKWYFRPNLKIKIRTKKKEFEIRRIEAQVITKLRFLEIVVKVCITN